MIRQFLGAGWSDSWRFVEAMKTSIFRSIQFISVQRGPTALASARRSLSQRSPFLSFSLPTSNSLPTFAIQHRNARLNPQHGVTIPAQTISGKTMPISLNDFLPSPSSLGRSLRGIDLPGARIGATCRASIREVNENPNFLLWSFA
jgi:hypothetical protein